MAQKNIYYKLVDKIINSFYESGIEYASFGDEEDLDIQNRVTDYPLVHITLTNVTHGVKNNGFSFIITVADKIDNTDNSLVKYSKDNTIDIQQNLMVKSEKAFRIINELNGSDYDDISTGYRVIYDINGLAFKDYPNLLAGFIYTFNVETPNQADDCD